MGNAGVCACCVRQCRRGRHLRQWWSGNACGEGVAARNAARCKRVNAVWCACAWRGSVCASKSGGGSGVRWAGVAGVVVAARRVVVVCRPTSGRPRWNQPTWKQSNVEQPDRNCRQVGECRLPETNKGRTGNASATRKMCVNSAAVVVQTPAGVATQTRT